MCERLFANKTQALDFSSGAILACTATMRSPIFVSLILAGVVASPGAVRADSTNTTRASSGADVHSGQIGIGLAVGHEWHIDERDGDQISLLARWRATARLSAELEIGKTEFHEGGDNKRLGAAVSYRIGNLSWLSPYLVAGGGASGSERQNMYLEAGGGVKFPSYQPLRPHARCSERSPIRQRGRC